MSTLAATATIAVTCAISILRARSFTRGRGDPPWVEPASHSSAPSSPLRLVAHAADVALYFIFLTANAAALTPVPVHATQHTESAAADTEPQHHWWPFWRQAAQCAGVHRVAVIWVRIQYPRVCRSRSNAPIGGEIILKLGSLCNHYVKEVEEFGKSPDGKQPGRRAG
ncbi:hypothetical protein DFH09DRAFT_1085602 [Mycena vulgaris]|nr:hypothetical protein DFH09DRAFT_1085602 [Mycena vulgaris]